MKPFHSNIDKIVKSTMVRVVGLEPTHHSAEEPKSSESTNSTTPAYKSTFIYVLMESTPKPPATFSLSSCHSGGTERTRTFVVRLTAVSPNHWTTVPNTRRVYNSFNPKLNVYINKFCCLRLLVLGDGVEPSTLGSSGQRSTS